MKEKQEIIDIYIKEYLKKQFISNLEQIQREYNLNAEKITQNYFNVITALLQKTKWMQEKKEKDAIQYICISFLRSSLYTKSHKYRIDVYGKIFYLDTIELYEEWKPDFIFNYFEKDIHLLLEYLRSKIIHIKKLELERIKNWYIYHYYYMIQKFCKDKLEELLNCIDISQIKTEDKLFILYGGYMEKGNLLLEK